MFNKVILIGRLTKEPELRNTQTGKSVVSASLATSKKWKDKDGQLQEKTEFHNLVVWQGAEAFAQYLNKGSKVAIEGELQTRNWDDPKSGTKKYTTEVVVNNFIFLDSKKQAEGSTTNEIKTNNNNEDEIKIEDIPF